jgi:hypothetical protein
VQPRNHNRPFEVGARAFAHLSPGRVRNKTK